MLQRRSPKPSPLADPAPRFKRKLAALADQLGVYRKTFDQFIGVSQSIDAKIGEMTGLAGSMADDAATMRDSAAADKARTEQAPESLIRGTQSVVLVLAVALVALGAFLAFFLSRGISRPIVRLCGVSARGQGDRIRNERRRITCLPSLGGAALSHMTESVTAKNAYPPLEGEGRLVSREARYETGWGDCSSVAYPSSLLARGSPHPGAARRPSPSRGG
jgi:hypothetical protein